MFSFGFTEKKVMRAFFMTRPDDWHVHFRENEFLASMVNATARHFSRALVMPNLKAPLISVERVLEYRGQILAARIKPPEESPSRAEPSGFPLPDGRGSDYSDDLMPGADFTPYMTLYINESLSIQELQLASKYPFILGAKLYPAGATTHSEQGAQSIRALYPLFDAMQALGLVLQVHGEVTHGDIFEREALFIEEELLPLTKNFPKLRIVLEHISTEAAVDFVLQAHECVAATITPQHLFYNRNQLLAGGIKPHYYCLPILKHARDQRAVQRAAVSGNRKFFAGTDSAPHVQETKESACGCAGIFSAPYALAIYAEVFDNLGRLPQLEAFMSQHGANFYRLPLQEETIELIKRPQTIPAFLEFEFGKIVPIGAGTVLQWSVHERG
jgi:dihydroorotase